MMKSKNDQSNTQPLVKNIDKKAFIYVESLISLGLFLSMVFLLVSGQSQQLRILRKSEENLHMYREQFHQLNAVQNGTSIVNGISINLTQGELVDTRGDRTIQYEIKEIIQIK